MVSDGHLSFAKNESVPAYPEMQNDGTIDHSSIKVPTNTIG